MVEKHYHRLPKEMDQASAGGWSRGPLEFPSNLCDSVPAIMFGVCFYHFYIKY